MGSVPFFTVVPFLPVLLKKGTVPLFLIAAVITATLAALAKPGAIVVPAICCLIDVLLIRRRDVKRALFASVCVLLPLIPLAIIARSVQHVNSFPPPAIWQRPFIAADAVTFYLGKLALPLGLGPDYGRTPAVVLARTITFLIPLLPLAIAVVLWRRPRAIALVGRADFSHRAASGQRAAGVSSSSSFPRSRTATCTCRCSASRWRRHGPWRGRRSAGAAAARR
jgi:hypothetical protein